MANRPSIPKKGTRARGWCFTINNPTPADYLLVRGLEAEHIQFQTERGKGGDWNEGTLHIQGFVYFANAKTFESMKKKIPRAHFENMKGTPKQASDYCQKLDTRVAGPAWSYGICPMQVCR